jgi:hypothetical protein
LANIRPHFAADRLAYSVLLQSALVCAHAKHLSEKMSVPVKKLIATSSFGLATLTVALLVACGGQVSATPANPTPDAGAKPDSSVRPPPPPPREAGVVDAAGLAPVSFPTAVRQGGPVIASPKIIPIVFAGDPLAENVVDFTRKLGPSDYWKASVTTEYGVGAITTADLVVVNEAPPALIDDTDVKAWLQAKLGAPEGVLGQPDGSTLYALYYPASTTITLEGDKSCQGFGGYHNETVAGGIAVAYAVMPRCSGGGTSALDYLTVVASHEYVEWATDPFPFTAPAYQGMDNNHLAWTILGGELSDLCTALDGDRYVRPADIGYSVQTQWSNKASLAGEHPCIPNEGRPYVVAVPETPDSIDVGERGTTLLTRGISVPRGGSKTVRIQVHAHGTNSKEALFLSVMDSKTGSEPDGYTFEFSSDTIAPGQVVNLKITAAKNASYAIPLLILGDNRRDAGLWPFLIEAK